MMLPGDAPGLPIPAGKKTRYNTEKRRKRLSSSAAWESGSFVIVEKEFGIKDKGVLNAIASHVTGRRHWTKLEQIVYLADKVEPTRTYPGAGIVRELLGQGEFERALLEGLRNAITYAAQSKGWIVDTETVVVFNEIAKTQT